MLSYIFLIIHSLWIMPRTTHEINNTTANIKFLLFFGITDMLNINIPVKIINFLHLKHLSNQTFLRLFFASIFILTFHNQISLMAAKYRWLKRSSIEGLTVAAGEIVEPGYVYQTLNAKHYKRGMHLHKLV